MPSRSVADVIGIPQGTRLFFVVLHQGEVHVWTAVARTALEYKDWRGTYLRIQPSGRVTRVNTDDNYTVDDEFIIKE